MLGAYIGDIIGSVYEFHPIKTKDFPLFSDQSHPTDDSVMTCAVARVFKAWAENTQDRSDKSGLPEKLVASMHELGDMEIYANVGYGTAFLHWLVRGETRPYNSFGNGAAMRCSAAGWFAQSLEEAMELGRISAAVTHNHPEGIKGAEVTAGCIFLARQGTTKEAIREFASKYYNLNFTLDALRPTYEFDVTCQGTVPPAIQSLLEAEDFEDAIRNAVSLGGDADTLAAITGSIAEPFFGIPEAIRQEGLAHLDDVLKSVLFPEQLK